MVGKTELWGNFKIKRSRDKEEVTKTEKEWDVKPAKCPGSQGKKVLQAGGVINSITCY